MSAHRTPRTYGLVAATVVLLAGVAAAELAVGVYLAVNPNHIQFGAPWPAAAELIGAAVIVLLAAGAYRQAHRPSGPLFTATALAAAGALALLAFVAFALSFDQT